MCLASLSILFLHKFYVVYFLNDLQEVYATLGKSSTASFRGSNFMGEKICNVFLFDAFKYIVYV